MVINVQQSLLPWISTCTNGTHWWLRHYKENKDRKKCEGMSKTLSTKHSYVYMHLVSWGSVFWFSYLVSFPAVFEGKAEWAVSGDLSSALPNTWCLISLTLSFPRKIRRWHQVSHSQTVINRTIWTVLVLCLHSCQKKKGNVLRGSLRRCGLTSFNSIYMKDQCKILLEKWVPALK